jgi:hypothetical protein
VPADATTTRLYRTAHLLRAGAARRGAHKSEPRRDMMSEVDQTSIAMSIHDDEFPLFLNYFHRYF